MNGAEVTERTRAKRSDAGKVRQTARDAQALEWLSEMYGAPVDVVASLLGTTTTAAVKAVARWQRAGWVLSAYADSGPAWAWPTKKTAEAYLGFEVAEWVPRPSMTAHTRAVAVARLALAKPGDTWVSERRLLQSAPKKELGKAQPYVPDAVLNRAEAGQWNVEVELTAKGVKRTRAVLQRAMTAATAADAQGEDAGVLYVAGSSAVKTVVETAWKSVAAEHPQLSKKFRIMMLSELYERLGMDEPKPLRYIGPNRMEEQ